MNTALLKQIMKEKHYTQRRLSDETGIALSTICRLCNGGTVPYRATTHKIALELGMTPDQYMQVFEADFLEQRAKGQSDDQR